MDLAGCRWTKSPAEVEQQLLLMWQGYREQLTSEPAELIEDIFTDILDRQVGWCSPEAVWTEPVPDSPQP